MTYAHASKATAIPSTSERTKVTRASGKLVSKIRLTSTVTLSERREMWNLYSSFYDGATFESFSLDLSEKTHVFMVFDSEDKSLKGFSTVKVFDRIVDNKQVIAIYSGDTIVHPDYWGQKTLHIAMFLFFARVKLSRPMTRVFWFLVCNGYRTYMGFARNVPNHWPHHNRETPTWIRSVINVLAQERFGENWISSQGIVKFKDSLGLLKETVAPIGPNELSQPEIRFLVKANPGYAHGDELACLGEIDFRLFFSFPLKCIKVLFKSLFKKKSS